MFAIPIIKASNVVGWPTELATFRKVYGVTKNMISWSQEGHTNGWR